MTNAARMFKALADPSRLRLVLLLLERDLCVCELTFILRMEQSRVSHQLKILREAGLAVDKRQGRWIIYGLKPTVRRKWRPLLENVLGSESRQAAIRAADLKKMNLCLSRDVRGAKRPVPSGGRR